jgi:DNA-binding beta-propeller fold protein YncE
MRSRGLAVLAVAGALVLPAGAARAGQVAAPTATAAHQAEPQVTVGQLTGFHQIVVDDAEGYVFLSEGEDSASIQAAADPSTALVVTTLSGAYVTTLDAGSGVEGLALTPDGKTLYVALAAKDAVAALDVTTIAGGSPAQTLYALPSGWMPYDLVLQSGVLWVSYDGGSAASFGDFDLTQ